MRASAERVALALALLAAAPAASAQDRCAACHAALPEPRLRGPAQRVAESAHRSAEVGCVGCHGGRRAEPTVSAHDPAAGFVARPSPGEVVERCGSCHADARFIRRQGAALQVDQLALFRQDPHGRAIARGARGATCAGCHGAHDVLPAHDPASRTHPTRVAALCGGCHGGPSRADGSREGPAALWHRSVHGEALARGDAHAPTCAACHGRHGERVEAGGAAGACASCHPDEARRSSQGPHGAAFARLGFGVCGPCHGAHDIAPAADRLLGVGGDASCTRCHASGQRAWAAAQRLASTRDRALADLRRAQDALRHARERGVEVPGEAAAQRALTAAASRMRSVAHELDEATMTEAARETRAAALRVEVAARTARSRRLRERRQWLYALGPLGALLGLLLIKLRRLERRA